MDILLEVRNLCTVFKTKTEQTVAVNHINFTLYRGQTVGIVGESGSGKSVTSLSIMRLISSPPGEIVSGEIIYHHKDGTTIDLLSLSEKEMRTYRGNEIAMIFQEPMTSLNPVFTCGNQVVEAIVLHQKISKKQAKQKTLRLFEKVKLPQPNRIFKAYPHELSGGQKQRVMIAMAMSCKPDILIADEPTTALDVTVQKTILDLMADLKEEIDASILFITHDLGVVADIADYVMVMHKGEIVEQGSVQQIFTRPEHAYTKGLLACRPPLDKRLIKLPTVQDYLTHTEELQQIRQSWVIPPESIEKRLEKIQSKTPVLSVKNLCTWFPYQKTLWGKTTRYIKAVDNISFDVYPGETLGLVGESGCGKTTLGRTILGLISPTSGDIYYKNHRINQLSGKAWRKLRTDMQIIFQDPYSSLNPRISIGQAIVEPMLVHGILKNKKERKNRAIELLKRVNLEEKHFDRYPHEFSGGQRQRICIARALALNPQFIVCDESVSALDVSVQAQVLNLLIELREEFDLTYIFISHDLSVVKFMSDRMIVMNKGQIEEIGPADEIYKHPKSPYTKRLIESIPKGL